jgi:plastocyanin
MPQAGAAAGGAAESPHQAAAPALIHVNSGDNWFNPNVVLVARGGTVTWDFVGKTHHTATDTTGMELYDSGSLSTGSYSYTFTAAGTYGFYCILHPEMGGRIHVPMRAKPSKGLRSTVFGLTWAAATAPDGYAYDVQVKRPGGTYQLWQDGVTATGGSFKADVGRGVYRFQARLRQLSSSEVSLWSDTVSISVT